MKCTLCIHVKQKQTKKFVDFLNQINIEFCCREIFGIGPGELGPDQFKDVDVYWIQTDRQAKYIQIQKKTFVKIKKKLFLYVKIMLNVKITNVQKTQSFDLVWKMKTFKNCKKHNE